MFIEETTNGRWLGYAVDVEAPAHYERNYRGCLLLLPDRAGDVIGAVVIGDVNIDATFAQDQGYEDVYDGSLLGEVGESLGEVRSGSPGHR